MQIFKRLGWFFKEEKWTYGLGIASLILVAALASIVPIMIGNMIDSMVNGTLNLAQLTKWVLIIVIINVVQYGLRYFWRLAIFGPAARLEQILRQRLFAQFTQMDATFYHKHRTGDLMAHATNDLNAIRMVAAGGILTLVDSLSQGLLTLAMMFIVVDWRLSLAAIIPLPLLAFGIRFNGKFIHQNFRRAQEAFSSLNDKVQESVTGMKVIKTFGEETLDIEDFQLKTQDVVAKNTAVIRYEALFRPMIQGVMGLSSVIGVFYGGYLVMQGEITIGLLVAFLNYVTRMGWPMVAIGELINILERGDASYERVQSLLRMKSAITEDPNGIREAIDGDLVFNVDYFAYPGTQQAALQQVHFTLPKGQTLGIVGKTGAGKSTIFKLLLREYDHYQGEISFNDQPIRHYQLNALKENIGFVPQDNFLFSTTVRDNIRFAKISATQAEVEQVAELTSVHQDILGFAQGYDTLVGERGVALSGGQKQRIAIARALMIEPELLILDDSLSAVDAKTEEQILTNLKANRQGKTTIIAAHRMSSVMHADEIIVLDNGKIIERGTHQALLEQAGWYKQMYDKQQLEAKLEEGDSNE
ncbi:ABC transporter transmembrane domain-containing protein [Aerococcaceae bacterium NML130460]|nr:ABC transporter transmembrane domain-containing protein [Aerococcaceae bacterium NML130460]